MNGMIFENGDYGVPYSRDGLGHGVDVGYTGVQSGWSARSDDWNGGDGNGANGGTFLEQCHATDCFFGCGGNHSPPMEHVGRYDSRRIGWRDYVDGDQGGILNNEMDYGLRNKHLLDSRYPSSSRYSRSEIFLF